MKMNRLIPMLPVKSMPASVEFYKKLGFSVEKKDDHWNWAMLVFGDCRLMVDESINKHPNSPRDSVLYLYPDDEDQAERMLEARFPGQERLLRRATLEDVFLKRTGRALRD